MLKPRFKKVFDLAIDEIFASGGDGFGYIAVKYGNYLDVAAQFELYLKENAPLASILRFKNVRDNSVSFNDGSNESISFGPPLDNPPVSEIYLQIY